MKSKILIAAPHPDDEVLGAGGTLLRKKTEGAEIAWMIITTVPPDFGWSEEKYQKRAAEINQVTELFQFDAVFELNFPAAQLEQIPTKELVGAISNVFREFQPNEVLVPHPSDVHTDHRVVFDAVTSCTKWFRYPSVKRVLAYETISETDFGLAQTNAFSPNVFVNIENYLDKKMDAMRIYESEMGTFPFPRSEEAIRALAAVRGAASGYKAAEAFQLLRERY